MPESSSPLRRRGGARSRLVRAVARCMLDAMSDAARPLRTVADLEAFAEDERVELIDGQIVQEAMTSFEHGDAQLSLGSELKSHFRGGGPHGNDGWWLGTDVARQCEFELYRLSLTPPLPSPLRCCVRPDRRRTPHSTWGHSLAEARARRCLRPRPPLSRGERPQPALE